MRFKLDGKLCEEKAIFNVKEPTVTFEEDHDPPPMGTVQLTDAKNRVVIYPPPATGITFNARVKVPAGFTEGSWHYVQIINPSRGYKVTATGKCFSIRTTKTVVDTTYPYEPPPYDPDAGSPGSYPTGDTFRIEKDHPSAGLPDDHNQAWGADIWETYIMFKPAGAASKWVPLRVVRWKWNYCCTNTEGTWSLDEKGASASSWKSISDHPTWDGNSTDLAFEEVVCPPPCEAS